MKRYIAGVLVCLCVVGCGLTVDQMAALNKYEAQLEKLHSEAEGFRDELMAYDDEIAAVVAKVKAKEIPFAEGMALVQTFMERKAETVKAYKDVRAAIDATWQAKVDLEKQAVPWYSIALSTAFTVLGALGLKKYQGIVGITKAVINGVEKSESKEAKEAIQREAELSGVEAELHALVKSTT